MMDNHEQEQVVDSSTNHRPQAELTLEEKKEIYTWASCRARRRMGLYIHATTFVFVILLLTVINLLTTPRYLWVVWPFFGWGIGVFLHWLFAGKLAPAGNLVKVYKNIEAEEIAKRLEQLGHQEDLM